MNAGHGDGRDGDPRLAATGLHLGGTAPHRAGGVSRHYGRSLLIVAVPVTVAPEK